MANVRISDLTSAAAALSTQQIEVNESGTSKKITNSQLLSYIEGEISTSPTFTGQVSIDDGTAVAPTLTNTGDTNTGIYFPAADTISFSTGGTLRGSFDASGDFVTTGSINTSGSLTTTGAIELGNASDTTITRSSAGVISVEGGIIPKENRANTFTADQTITGNLTVSGAIIGVFPSGTKMLFQQTAAPTGWTKDTTHNDKVLRVVSGAASSGGTVVFSTAFANRTVSGNVDNFTATGTVNGHALTIGQLPSHSHYVASGGGGTSGALSGSNYVDFNVNYSTNNNYILNGTSVGADRGLASYIGSNETHAHTFTGTAHSHAFSTTLDMAVQYVDLIIATKN